MAALICVEESVLWHMNTQLAHTDVTQMSDMVETPSLLHNRERATHHGTPASVEPETSSSSNPQLKVGILWQIEELQLSPDSQLPGMISAPPRR